MYISLRYKLCMCSLHISCNSGLSSPYTIYHFLSCTPVVYCSDGQLPSYYLHTCIQLVRSRFGTKFVVKITPSPCTCCSKENKDKELLESTSETSILLYSANIFKVSYLLTNGFYRHHLSHLDKCFQWIEAKICFLHISLTHRSIPVF